MVCQAEAVRRVPRANINISKTNRMFEICYLIRIRRRRTEKEQTHNLLYVSR